MKKIVIFGAGNLATNLAVNLQNAEFEIAQIYSRNILNAKKLAEKITAQYTDKLENITSDADIYFFCVSDIAINQILENITLSHKLLLHTAGAVDINILKKYTDMYGVFYPMQSLTKNKIISFKKIPILLEANNKQTKDILYEMAKKLSDNVTFVNSEKRALHHLIAVFVNNFTNFMLSCGFKISQNENIDFSIFHELLKETTARVIATTEDPFLFQTGPAVRQDVITLNKHLSLIEKYPQFKNIYQFISEKITNYDTTF